MVMISITLAVAFTHQSDVQTVQYSAAVDTEKAPVRGNFANFSGPALSVIHGDPALQGSDCGVLFPHIHRLGFLRSAYHTVWVSLPGSAADHSPALPAKRDCAALANSPSILPVGQYPRV